MGAVLFPEIEGVTKRRALEPDAGRCRPGWWHPNRAKNHEGREAISINLFGFLAPFGKNLPWPGGLQMISTGFKGFSAHHSYCEPLRRFCRIRPVPESFRPKSTIFSHPVLPITTGTLRQISFWLYLAFQFHATGKWLLSSRTMLSTRVAPKPGA